MASGRPARARVVSRGISIGMAFQAEPVRESHQVVRVGAMNEMAGETPVAARSHVHRMVERERAFLVRMALVTQLVAIGFQLPVERSRHRVMAVVACDPAFLNRMMRPHIELGPLFQVTHVTELQLAFLDEELVVAGVTAMT